MSPRKAGCLYWVQQIIIGKASSSEKRYQQPMTQCHNENENVLIKENENLSKTILFSFVALLLLFV
jgi:hypothetical protein